MLEFHLKQEEAKGVNHPGNEKGVLVPVACVMDTNGQQVASRRVKMAAGFGERATVVL